MTTAQPEADEPHVCKSGATVYYWPTVADTESDCHGGFDVCCARPDLHQQILRCSLAHCRQAHAPHSWEPQPGMKPVYCEGFGDADAQRGDKPAATHQGPGVYGGLETHRGARHECPAPDCGPQGIRINPNPDDEDSVLIHFPEVEYVDTQVWSADIGISTDALRELRDAIDKRLGDSDEIAELKRERDVLRRSLARLSHTVAAVAMFAFGRDDSRRALLRTKWLTADRVLAYTSGPEEGCDCDRTALRRSWHAGHLVTCPSHVGRQGRTAHYGKKAGR